MTISRLFTSSIVEDTSLFLDLSALCISDSEEERGRHKDLEGPLEESEQQAVPQTPALLARNSDCLGSLCSSAISPIDNLPSSVIFDQNSALLTPFGYSSASPSPVHFISITSPQDVSDRLEFETSENGCSTHHTQDDPTKATGYTKRSLFVIPESPLSGISTDSIPVHHLDSTPSTTTTNGSLPPVPPSPIQPPKKRTFLNSRATPGFLRSLPEFSIPSTPPFGQSPVMTPGGGTLSPPPIVHRVCSPLKSPFLIRRKSEEATVTVSTPGVSATVSKEDASGGYFRVKAQAV